jgi:hypothetical protein
MRKTASRLIAAGMTAAVLTLGLTASAAITASSALAGPYCHGTSPSCVGHDPVIYSCVISHTNRSPSDSYATVWGEFSNNCDSKWAEAQLTPQSVKNGYTMQFLISTDDGTQLSCTPGPSNTGNWKEYCNGYDGASTVGWTDMVDGHKAATAYVYVFNSLGRFIHQIQVSA